MRRATAMKMAFGLALLSGQACDERPEKQPEMLVKIAPPTADQVAAAKTAPKALSGTVSLGGGYQGIPWGVDAKTAELKLKGRGKIERDRGRDGSFTIRFPDDKTAEFGFYRNRLYRVAYDPNLGDPERDRPALLSAMEKRFGPSVEVVGMIDTLLEQPLAIRRWSDGETQIDLRWLASPPDGVSSGGEVIYISLAIAKERGAAIDAAESSKRGKGQAAAAQHL